MKIDEAWFSLDECIDTIAENEIKERSKDEPERN